MKNSKSAFVNWNEIHFVRIFFFSSMSVMMNKGWQSTLKLANWKKKNSTYHENNKLNGYKIEKKKQKHATHSSHYIEWNEEEKKN